MAFDKDHDGLKREFSANLQSFGQNGFKIVGATAVEGDFVAITALSDSVVTTVLPDDMDWADALQAHTIPAGVTVYGKFKSVTATSGQVIAYNLTEG